MAVDFDAFRLALGFLLRFRPSFLFGAVAAFFLCVGERFSALPDCRTPSFLDMVVVRKFLHACCLVWVHSSSFVSLNGERIILSGFLQPAHEPRACSFAIELDFVAPFAVGGFVVWIDGEVLRQLDAGGGCVGAQSVEREGDRNEGWCGCCSGERCGDFVPGR